jgi:S1-C subfamily serine protease
VKSLLAILLRFWVFILFAGCPFQTLRADSIPEIVARSKSAIIEIVAFDSQNRPIKSGTGFFITADGVAVTNWHVIQGANSLAAMANDGAVFVFERVLYVPPGADLAILKFAAHDAQWLKLGSTDSAMEGQRVLVIGNPTGLQGTVSDGLIAAFREDRSIIQITAPISPGSSGSPVLDENGLVIGVATLQRVEGQNLNFAIAAETVKAALYSLLAEQNSQQQVTQTTPTPPVFSGSERASTAERSAPDLKKFVRDFVASGNYDDPSVESSFYAEQVDYFDDGKVSKDFVISDIRNYNQRWPKRGYWVNGEPTIRVVGSERDIVRAVVTIGFGVSNGRKSVKGSCEDVLLIRDASSNPKVISVKSKFLSRSEKPSGR